MNVDKDYFDGASYTPIYEGIELSTIDCHSWCQRMFFTCFFMCMLGLHGSELAVSDGLNYLLGYVRLQALIKTMSMDTSLASGGLAQSLFKKVIICIKECPYTCLGWPFIS